MIGTEHKVSSSAMIFGDRRWSDLRDMYFAERLKFGGMAALAGRDITVIYINGTNEYNRETNYGTIYCVFSTRMYNIDRKPGSQ